MLGRTAVRVNRLSIAGLMGVVLVVALGLVALKEGTETWASATFLLTSILLLGAVLSAMHGRGALRAGWIGFALFGWAYMLFVFGGWWGEPIKVSPPPVPTRWLLDQLHERIHAKPQLIPNPAFTTSTVTFSPGFQIVQPQIVKPGTTPWQGNYV